MIFKTDAETLAGLWTSLCDQDVVVRGPAVARHVAAIVERGWAPRWRVEDLLVDLGASWFWRDVDVSALFDVPLQTVFDRPRAGCTAALGFDEMAAADLARVLIDVERLGLGIDPSPLVEALRPALVGRPVLTRSELAVFWYPRERHRVEPITVKIADAALQMRPERVVLATGYKAEAHRGPDGAIGSLTIRAPKHRRMRRAA